MPATSQQFLRVVARRRGSALVVTTMTAAKVWPLLANSPLDVNYLPSAMGHASDLALGLALADPDRTVVCVNGDGSLLMNLGTLATIAAAGATNLVMLVMANGTYRIVGQSPVPAAGGIRWHELARSCGWPVAKHCGSTEELDAAWPELSAGRGPALAWLDVVDPPSIDECLPPVHPAASLRNLRRLTLETARRGRPTG